MDETYEFDSNPDRDADIPVLGDDMYDVLRQQLAKDPDIEPVTLPVPSRRGLSVRFDPNIEVDLFQSWVKRATNRRTKQTNIRTLANIVLTNTHTATLVNGKEVLAKDGRELTFVTEELQQMMGAVGPNDAITKMYGLEGHILQHMRSILDAAGFGDEEDWGDEFGDTEDGPFGS